MSVVVVLLCGSSNFVRSFMLVARKRGMTEGDYVYIEISVVQPDNVKQPWWRNDVNDAEAKLAYFPLLQVREPRFLFVHGDIAWLIWLFLDAERLKINVRILAK
jgi:hypothetical protein